MLASANRQTGQWLFKVIIVLGTCCLLLAVLCVYFALQAGKADLAAGTRDREREAAEVEAMVSGRSGLWDSHPDADVGRVLQPDLKGRKYVHTSVDSNQFGLRERNYEIPKPANIVRVVLLGDSYIFGYGVDAEQRLGVLLEKQLEARQHAGAQVVEVLHLGNPSWNLVAECSFLRRQLSLLRPDLVLHVSVSNDLADTTGVRGFGSMGRFVPRRPSRGDTVIKQAHPRWALDSAARGHLARGLDFESRSRFVESGQHMERLAKAVEAVSGRYEHVFHWGHANTEAAAHLAQRLAPEQTSWLPPAFHDDLAVRLSAEDAHWSPQGHEQMARFLFGLIEARDLLPVLALDSWPEAVESYVALNGQGRSQAMSAEARTAQRLMRAVPSELVIARRTTASSSTVHGGIDGEGLVGPYASVILSRQGGKSLRVLGAFVDRPELDGAKMQVFVDEQLMATLPLQAGELVDLSLALPEALIKRPWLTVRFVTNDFAYSGESMRDCVSFQLERVAVE